MAMQSPHLRNLLENEPASVRMGIMVVCAILAAALLAWTCAPAVFAHRLILGLFPRSGYLAAFLITKTSITILSSAPRRLFGAIRQRMLGSPDYDLEELRSLELEQSDVSLHQAFLIREPARISLAYCSTTLHFQPSGA
jgi:hypothetical protein